MIYLSSQQLQQILIKKTCYYCYIIFGNNLFLLNDTQNFILEYLTCCNTYDQFTFSLDNQSQLKKIFEISHTQNLFNYRKKIFLFQQSNKKIDNAILKEISFLIPLIHQKLFLIFRINKLTITLKNFFDSYKNFKKYMVFIECNTPRFNELIPWISQRAKNMQINLNQSSCKLLFTYYEDDLNALNQVLYQLSIIYPKQNLNDIHIKNLINDTSSYFHLSHLLNTILKRDKKRFNRILNKLYIENIIKPLTILHSIQHIIILLVICKRKLLEGNHSMIMSILNKYKIQKNLHSLFIKALYDINLKKLYLVIELLLQTEIIVHKEHESVVLENLKSIIWLLSNNIDNTK